MGARNEPPCSLDRRSHRSPARHLPDREGGACPRHRCAVRRDREAIITKVREFSTFTPDHDPYGEHDFGAIEQESVGTVFWKIDYYDVDYECGSPDPADPKVTRRVLTIMLAEEY
jgi:hypothetical protein